MSSDAWTPPAWLPWLSQRPWLSLGLLTLLLYLPATATLPLVDRDEPRFARATEEMLERGTWAVPYFNGEYRFDKPPLVYWMMTGAYAVFGDTDFAARAHSILSTWLTAGLIVVLGSRLFSREAAWLGAFGWLTCLQTLQHGRLCIADMALMIGILLTHLGLWMRLREPEGPRFGAWFWALWGGLAVGSLAKWVVVPAVLVATLGLYRMVFWRKPVPWLSLQPMSGAAVAALPIIAWAVPAYLQTGGAFFAVGMGEHVVDRGLSPFNNRFPLPGYYLLTAFLSLMPWIFFLPLAWRHLRRDWDERRAFLVSWIAGTYAMFSVAMTQLPHYVMPAFPAFFLLLFKEPRQWLGAELGRLHTTRVLSGLYLTAALALAVLALGPWLSGETAPLRAVAAGGAGVVLSLVALPFLLRNGQLWAIPIACVAFGVCFELAARQLREVHASVRLAEVLPEQGGSATGYSEPSIVWYTGYEWSFVDDPPDLPPTGIRMALAAEYRIEDAAKALLTGATLAPARDDRDQLAAVAESEPTLLRGLNLGRFSWVELWVWGTPENQQPPSGTAERPADEKPE